MTRWQFMAAGLAIIATALAPTKGRADDVMLSGAVVSSSGEKMGKTASGAVWLSTPHIVRPESYSIPLVTLTRMPRKC